MIDLRTREVVGHAGPPTRHHRTRQAAPSFDLLLSQAEGGALSPHSTTAPQAQIHRLPRQEVDRQLPRAPGPHRVQDGVGHISACVLRHPTRLVDQRQQRLNEIPLDIGQVRVVRRRPLHTGNLGKIHSPDERVVRPPCQSLTHRVPRAEWQNSRADFSKGCIPGVGVSARGGNPVRRIGPVGHPCGDCSNGSPLDWVILNTLHAQCS